jgi:hypothetical protein
MDGEQSGHARRFALAAALVYRSGRQTREAAA